MPVYNPPRQHAPASSQKKLHSYKTIRSSSKKQNSAAALASHASKRLQFHTSNATPVSSSLSCHSLFAAASS